MGSWIGGHHPKVGCVKLKKIAEQKINKTKNKK